MKISGEDRIKQFLIFIEGNHCSNSEITKEFMKLFQNEYHYDIEYLNELTRKTWTLDNGIYLEMTGDTINLISPLAVYKRINLSDGNSSQLKFTSEEIHDFLNISYDKESFYAALAIVECNIISFINGLRKENTILFNELITDHNIQDEIYAKIKWKNQEEIFSRLELQYGKDNDRGYDLSNEQKLLLSKLLQIEGKLQASLLDIYFEDIEIENSELAEDEYNHLLEKINFDKRSR